MTYDLRGKTILITGATSGIGLAAVKKSVGSGAFVIGVGRSAERNEQACRAVINEAANPKSTSEKIHYLLAELSIQEQVRAAAVQVAAKLNQFGYRHLDVLINNAGVYLEKRVMTEDGIEKTFAVNHLAPFLLTYKLMPQLRQAEKGRVLTVSSYAHFTTPLTLSRIVKPWPYIGLLAYKRSKLCNVLFTYEFNRRFDEVTAYAIDPGLVDTGIASKGSDGLSDLVWRRRRKQGMSPAESVKTLILLSSDTPLKSSDVYYLKQCQPKTPSRNARNVNKARALWDLSCQLTGIKW